MVAIFCCVPGCYNNSLRNSEMKFFKFPKGGRLRSVWITAIRTYTKADSFQPEDFHQVCEAHFNEKQRSSENKMPTIFRVAKPRTNSRYNFFGHKLRNNLGAEGTKCLMVDHATGENELTMLSTNGSDTEGTGNMGELKPDIASMSKDLSRFEFQPGGRSKELRKLSVGNVNKFAENWTPENSIRETRKLNRKPYIHPTRRNAVYDENGILVRSGKDVCDCFEEDCPGCHFPCPKCSSTKCGHECRNNRRWGYDTLEIEGKEGIIKNKNKA